MDAFNKTCAIFNRDALWSNEVRLLLEFWQKFSLLLGGDYFPAQFLKL
jgi:hypothetical protein